jgi:D-alanyl-D-alanine carboxypeptidase
MPNQASMLTEQRVIAFALGHPGLGPRRISATLVSTLDDELAFLDAFFGGRLLPAALLAEMATDWHRIFFLIQYGTGIMRFSMPRVLTGFRVVPPFVGHSGASGTVMFRAADLGVTVVGTVNQSSTARCRTS